MKRTQLAVALLLLCAPSKCDDTPVSPEQQARETAEEYNARGRKLMYFRDPRVDVCFAYIWEGMGAYDSRTGGPGLASVPCERVERILSNPPEFMGSDVKR